MNHSVRADSITKPHRKHPGDYLARREGKGRNRGGKCDKVKKGKKQQYIAAVLSVEVQVRPDNTPYLITPGGEQSMNTTFQCLSEKVPARPLSQTLDTVLVLIIVLLQM